MNNDRSRKTSQGAQHVSPLPSPRSFPDPTAGLDPSFSGHYGTGPEVSFSQQDVQPYMNNYSIGPADNTYLGLASTYNDLLHGNQLGNDLSQDYSVNQFNVSHDNINPQSLSKISSPDNLSPRLLSPDAQISSGPQSPASTNGQFHTPAHSRNTSLDPNSAYTQGDWQSYRNPHSPSELSDRSSVHGSPYLQHVDIDGGQPSPLFSGQDNNTFGLDTFTINENHSQPGSAYASPRLIPLQEGVGVDQHAMLNPNYQMGTDMFSSQSFVHSRNPSILSDMGQADQLAPPTINIEPAPVSRQTSFGPQGEEMPNALSPPMSSGRGRVRAQSDVTFSRPMARSVSPSKSRDNLSVRSPSPSSASRSSSPGVSDGRISKDRRASTSAINNNNREYILDLADPNRPNGGQSGNSTRVQKHPATFQCNLCPKRFTRAYNLRSHLRTHTDERPFVCTVCGKAFARQHDRKRHEGLHSGEKKFVCRGELHSAPGQTWGCGRRFARADALGRHFRSEAGRVCIKPLLDEEAAERQQKMMMEQQAQQQAHLQPVPPPLMMESGFSLPAALMLQYPQLANIDWAAVQNQAGDDPGELSDIGIGGGYDDGLDAGGLSDSGTYGHTGQW